MRLHWPKALDLRQLLQRADLLEIVPGAEALARGGEDDHAHLLVLRNVLEGGLQGGKHLGGEQIHLRGRFIVSVQMPSRSSRSRISSDLGTALMAQVSIAAAERAFSRSRNFWILPVEVLGSSPNTTARGTADGRGGRGRSDDLGFRDGGAGLELDERARRLAPPRVGLGDHRGGEHRGMAVEHVLDLERRDVLAARDDDVLGAVLDLEVAVGVHHGEVAGMEPAAGEGRLGGLRVLEVALHGDVAAEHDLAHGLAVGGHRRHGLGVHHREALFHQVAHALTAVQRVRSPISRAFHSSCLAHTVAGPYTSVSP